MVRGRRPNMAAKLTTLAKNLRRIRDAKGLSQMELNKLAGVTNVSMIENGMRAAPRMNTLKPIADALGVTVADLYAETERHDTVPLVGYVGKAGQVYSDPVVGEWGEIAEVEAPPGAPAGTIALQVRGAALSPRYDDGDMLYCLAAGEGLAECFGRECLVVLRGRPAVVRRAFAAGSGVRLVAVDGASEVVGHDQIERISRIGWTSRSWQHAPR
jgi:transcriptional regulator with XRE-family HTH domain